MRQNLDNITYVQVEALRECFDFIKNGYRALFMYFGSDQWFIKLRHNMHDRWLRVYVQKWSYQIIRDGKVVKSYDGAENNVRYDVLLNSDVIITRNIQLPDGNENLVFGSVLTNNQCG